MAASPDPYTQLGVGAIFALLILDKVMPYLRPRNGKNGTSGQLPPSYWELKISGLIADGFRPVVDRLDKMIDKQNELLAEILRSRRD